MTQRYESIFYLSVSVLILFLIHWAPLTHDEFFTLYISQQPSLVAVWQCLKQSLDFHPPLYYVVTYFFTHWLGTDPWVLRLPSLLALVGLLVLARRWFMLAKISPLGQIAFHLFWLLTPALSYFFQSRGYSFYLFFSFSAFYFWFVLTQTKVNSVWTLAGFFLSLAGAFFSHFYAFLLVFPFIFAEVAAFWQTRRLAWMRVMGLGVCAGVSLIVLSPLIQHAKTFFGTFWGKANLQSIYLSYQYFLGERLFLFWIYTLCLLLLLGKTQQVKREQGWSLTVRTLVSGFILLPVFGVLLSLFRKAGFTPRYVLPVIVGFMSWGALLASSFSIRRSQKTFVFTIVAFVVAFQIKDVRFYRSSFKNIENNIAELKARTEPSVPIYFEELDTFFQFYYYAEKESKKQFTTANRPDLSEKFHRGKDSNYAPYALLELVPGLKTKDEFVREHDTFYIFTANPYAVSDRYAGMTITDLKIQIGSEFLFLAARTHPQIVTMNAVGE